MRSFTGKISVTEYKERVSEANSTAIAKMYCMEEYWMVAKKSKNMYDLMMYVYL